MSFAPSFLVIRTAAALRTFVSRVRLSIFIAADTTRTAKKGGRFRVFYGIRDFGRG